jgi:Holliday junction resolvase RusA-like endonuclease
MEINFWIPGDPVPKARARVTMRGGKPRAYTPIQTKKYEELAGGIAAQIMGSAEPLKTPVRLLIEFGIGIPRSWSQKRRDAAIAGLYVPTVKPDLTNLVKSIEDGMNGIVYRDDSQIVYMVVAKYYASTPGAKVCVIEMGEQATPR